ncbi:uncharacterized protein LOC101894940 isoform X2 [Musca domestica]|nr:uncharacterized protein LOC101894940 isoform X2 [Musca domestica]
MRDSLEFYERKLPALVHVGKVLQKYNEQLYQIPTQVEITNIRTNPFNFQVKATEFPDLDKYIKYSFVGPKIKIKIRCAQDDSNMSTPVSSNINSSTSASFDISTTHQNIPQPRPQSKISKEKRKQLKNNSKQACNVVAIASARSSPMSVESSSSIADENLVHISYVKSPGHFYIQRVSDIEKIRQLSQAYVDGGQTINIPKDMTIGYYYMAYNSADKQWYRGMLKKILPEDEYKVFLVDYGMDLTIPADKICNVHESHIKIPFAAVRCAIADIVPAGKEWTEVGKNFLYELLQNQHVRMNVIEKIRNDHLKVDLQTPVTTSVRESFLYAGLARERPGAHSFKMSIKKDIANLKLSEQIPRTYVMAGEILMVNMLHVVGPHEFYVIKDDLTEEKRKFLSDLNSFYGAQETQRQQMYLAEPGVSCAVSIADFWHRARIIEVKGNGSLLVRLVDEGRTETINWRQAYTLTEMFRQKREYAIRCTLADIEPLQENSYNYTATAISDFRQMTVNPCLRMEIQSTSEDLNRVLLYVSKKNLDINIGAALVKSRHGISTGETTQTSDCFRMTKKSHRIRELIVSENLKTNDCSSITSLKSSKDLEPLPVQRSQIIITHIVDPGEFYIQLYKLKMGTDQFHAKIQETLNEKFHISANCIDLPTRENQKWTIGSHCLVYTKYNSTPTDPPTNKNCEWYRGIVIEANHEHVSETTYSVFLRDIGATIRSIASHQLFSIGAQLDRVTNAVYRCHLAGICPAGNVKTWSKSAIDWFRYSIKQFELQWVSMRGKRLEETNSLPVVLWGSSTDTTDPLAPCIIKFTNISKILVEKGLAYSPGTTDTITEHFHQIEGIDLKEGEITIQKWFKSLEDDMTLNAIDRREHCRGTLFNEHAHANNPDAMDDIIDDTNISDGHPFDVYLNNVDAQLSTGMDRASVAWTKSKDLNKTLFAGYPTYVDYDGIIFLHEADDKEFLTKMSNIMSKLFANVEEPSADYVYTAGQPCIAKYHLDSKIYRAYVKKEKSNDKEEIEVRFVDYGDVENVVPKDIRPYAPFPNMPSLASRYQLIGIQPNNESGEFSVDVLDQMHLYIVGKFVSVRLSPTELTMPIKKCNMRLGTVDVAATFIEKGWAAAETLMPGLSSFNNVEYTNEPRRNRRNPFSNSNSTDYEDFDANNLNENEFCIENEASNWMVLPQYKEDNISNVIEHLDKRHDNLLSKITQTGNEHKNSFAIPPTKKRMFDHSDYTQMMNGGLLLDVDDLSNVSGNDHKMVSFSIADDDDEDVVEMSHNFAMNYWHSATDDTKRNEEYDICQQLEHRISFQEEEDIESEYEHFYPDETSTIFTHFSGIDVFKTPHFPGAQQQFKCRVIKIISPTVLHIIPITTDYKKQDINMQIAIGKAAKTARPLTSFKRSTPCLACYSKDKKWYRAVIRSNNKISKTVDVLYVDYLNSETLPTKYIRECPPEVLSWPQRTLRVRLHGLIANMKVDESAIRLALHRTVSKRDLIAVVKKYRNCQTSSIDTLSATKKLNEISLYESEYHLSLQIPIYEHLIKSNFYSRL